MVNWDETPTVENLDIDVQIGTFISNKNNGNLNSYFFIACYFHDLKECSITNAVSLLISRFFLPCVLLFDTVRLFLFFPKMQAKLFQFFQTCVYIVRYLITFLHCLFEVQPTHFIALCK